MRNERDLRLAAAAAAYVLVSAAKDHRFPEGPQSALQKACKHDENFPTHGGAAR
jgi:hypothetical protein